MIWEVFRKGPLRFTSLQLMRMEINCMSLHTTYCSVNCLSSLIVSSPNFSMWEETFVKKKINYTTAITFVLVVCVTKLSVATILTTRYLHVTLFPAWYDFIRIFMSLCFANTPFFVIDVCIPCYCQPIRLSIVSRVLCLTIIYLW